VACRVFDNITILRVPLSTVSLGLDTTAADRSFFSTVGGSSFLLRILGKSRLNYGTDDVTLIVKPDLPRMHKKNEVGNRKHDMLPYLFFVGRDA